MGFAEWVLAVIAGIVVLDNLLMFLYCIFAERMDQRFFRKRAAASAETKTEQLEDAKAQNERRNLLGKVYSVLNAYAYGLMRYNLIIVGKIPSTRIRHVLYKHVYRMKLSKKSVIYGGCEIRSPWNITIGNSVIAVGCLLDGRQRITIGDNVVFGSFVHLWTEEHDLNDPYFRVTPAHSQPIVVEDYSWICSDSTVLPGTVIKEGAVVAARACVTKDCEAYTVYGGVPAKKIAERSRDLRYELSGKPTWHFY